ncbi:MAG: phosphatidate cytidylyltransferase [Rhodoluna sp.]|nr:phosphatidate cytidylyltransferase [Rhodoluna sp.]
MSAAKPEGRSLSKSISVGLLLGGIFLFTILTFNGVLFMAFVAAATGAGAWELSTALRLKGWYVPRVPAVVGSVVIMPATYFFGQEAQWLVSIGIVAALIIWRTVHLLWERRVAPIQALQNTLRDYAAAAFLVIYLPLTCSFSVMLLRRPEDGQWWVLTFVLTVAMIDTFGYLVGRKLGRHKLAPGVSPKKTIEGLLASITAGLVAAICSAVFWLHIDWWWGVILAAAMTLTAVFGDLAESLIKRDLGVKDMSSWLPGHGGVMDRLDSILPSALVMFIIVSLFFS